MPRKVLCAFPPGMLEQIDFIATVEHRTRSDLIREALRRYVDGFKTRCGLSSLDSVQQIAAPNVINLQSGGEQR